jgi:hypothetical protein
MTRRFKISGAVVVGVLLGAVASLLTAEAIGGDSPSTQTGSRSEIGAMSEAELESFSEFPIYSLPDDFMGLRLVSVTRISPETLAEAARLYPPLETLGRPERTPESRGHAVRPDYVTLAYGHGSCESPAKCVSPIRVQIWQLCNRSLDDYEASRDVPMPHRDLTIRGTQAAEIADRLELYAGSATIVLFADLELARSAAEVLVPVNGKATEEMALAEEGNLPAAERGPDCA